MTNYYGNAANYQMGGANPYQQQYMGQPVVPMTQQMPANNNALSEEEIKLISTNKPSKVDISIPQEENYRAMCTHKYQGKDVVQQVNDGSGDVYCPICGFRWNPTPLSKEDVQAAVDVIIGQMQNCKWVGDLNTPLVRDYFPMIPLLMKLPDISEYAMNTFNKYFYQNGYQNSNDASIYSQFNQLMGYGNQNFYNPNGYANMQYPQQQPMMQQPVQQYPGYQNAPMQNPMQAQAPMNTQFTDQANMMMNGGYYQQPVQQQPMMQQPVQQAPVNQGYMPNFAPAQPQANVQQPVQQAPATPVEGDTVKSETVVQLN